MSIITLTLSPAFDIHCTVKGFTAGREHLASDRSRGIGGKGINISRALSENGIRNQALVLLGDENGDDFAKGLEECSLDFRALSVPGRIRENMTIHSVGEHSEETRISFCGFSADASHLDRLLNLCTIDTDSIITFTGSLPEGIDLACAENFLENIIRTGARLVIDSKSIPLDLLCKLRPWLIKPNLEEAEAYFGPLDFDKTVQTARELQKNGIANVMISLGADGAILACDEGVYLAVPPRIEAISTIGAGDSMIAGFISEDCESSERLASAVSWGTAACLTKGTNPPRPEDIARISKEVMVTKIR